MTAKPILFVAGFGRCGTTMMMTMLDRGGFPVVGPPPAYEVGEMSPMAKPDLQWLRSCAGKAVKWIDPLKARVSRNDLPVSPIIIHMDRAKRDMAASQVKFLSMFCPGAATNDRRTRRLFERSLIADAPILQGYLNATGTVYSFTFDWVLREPLSAAQKLAAIIRHEFDRDFDVAAAASVPLPRSPECAPGLSIEMSMQP